MTETSVRQPQRQAYLIFGAYGGVGCQLAQRLVARGADVVVSGRNPEKLSLLADSIGSHYVTADATNFSEVEGAFDAAKQHLGRLDGVINCVGTLLLKPAHMTGEREWNSILAGNLTSAFACVKHGAKAMMSDGGSIVLISSAAAHIGLKNHDAIAAAKAGIEGLVRSAAATYASRGIRVNCVAPGLLKTDLTQSITSNVVQLAASMNMHPLGRIGQPLDIAAAIDWLLSSEASWITGQVITVDGGLSTIKEIATSKKDKLLHEVTTR